MKIRIVALALLGALVPPRTAAAEAQWTVIVLLSAEYEDMESRLRRVGSSADVNVVVLHDKDGQEMVAYRVQPTTDPDNPPAVESLSLSAMGITREYIYQDGVLDSFLGYVQQRYGAKHYLISARGQMDGKHLLMHNDGGGMSIDELAEVLGRFEQRHGSNIDVLNVGLCLGGLVDWAYAVSPHVDYYVGAANYTNPPVAMRWRVYRWAAALIDEPSTSGRDLAAKMVDIFAESSDYCQSTGHDCSNAPDEPWTATAMDLSKMGEIAASAKQLVCSLVGDFDAYSTAFDKAANRAVSYGSESDSSRWARSDLGHFALQLENEVSDPAVKAAAAQLAAAVDSAVVKRVFEPGYFDAEASGLSGLFKRNSSGWSLFGPYHIDSMWELLMNEVHGLGEPPEITDLSIEPSPVEVEQGKTVDLTARAVSLEYGPMCAAPVDWLPELDDVGTLLNQDNNPVTFEALFPGSGTLRASLGGVTAEVTISVLPKGQDPQPGTDPAAEDSRGSDSSGSGHYSAQSSGGCSALHGGGGTSAWTALRSLLVLAGMAWLMGRAGTLGRRRERG